MHAIVADIRFLLQTQLLPLRQDLPSQRFRRRLSWVGGPEHLAPEICPGELGSLPLHSEIVDGRTWQSKLRPHGHEEAIEDVHGVLAVHLDEATIETATKLHQFLRGLRLSPLL